ncbi:translation elongation factor Ts [PVC group bacterium (ex Bugula neritina AB1)]|nr:translation elongation factor Ts [PVC group bacterium (ex Bugula neritina AB1)]
MMDCKKALQESSGDLEQAVQILRKKGIAKAEKKSQRDTHEGLISAYIAPDESKGALVEINCETDFVARNETFVGLTQKVGELISNGDLSAFDDQGGLKEDSDLFAAATAMTKEAVPTLGENLTFIRATRFDLSGAGSVGAYIHLGGKIGVLAQINGSHDDVGSIVKEISIHIAAAQPSFLTRDEVPEEVLQQEREVVIAQSANKPQQIVDKIVLGKLEKYYSEVCLLEQSFVKDPDVKIKDLLGDLSIVRFVRFQLGG